MVIVPDGEGVPASQHNGSNTSPLPRFGTKTAGYNSASWVSGLLRCYRYRYGKGRACWTSYRTRKRRHGPAKS